MNTIKQYWHIPVLIIICFVISYSVGFHLNKPKPIEIPTGVGGVGGEIEAVAIEDEMPADVTITEKTATFQEEVEEVETCEIVEEEEVCEITTPGVPEKKKAEITFTYDGETVTVGVDYAAYNDCRNRGKTKSVCLEVLKNQLITKVKLWKGNYDHRKAEDAKTEYGDEVSSKDL